MGRAILRASTRLGYNFLVASVGWGTIVLALVDGSCWYRLMFVRTTLLVMCMIM